MSKFMRLTSVKEATGLSRSSIYAFMEQGKFPRQIKIGERAVAWDDLDIQDWIEGRKQLSQEAH